MGALGFARYTLRLAAKPQTRRVDEVDPLASVGILSYRNGSRGRRAGGVLRAYYGQYYDSFCRSCLHRNRVLHRRSRPRPPRNAAGPSVRLLRQDARAAALPLKSRARRRTGRRSRSRHYLALTGFSIAEPLACAAAPQAAWRSALRAEPRVSRKAISKRRTPRS
jgi:hypothetical protein